jgi:putrescine aminotransferase
MSNNAHHQVHVARNEGQAQKEVSRILDLMHRPVSQWTEAELTRMEKETVDNFGNHINKGFLLYRKSMTVAEDFASVELSGQGSEIFDTRGRRFVDALGGYGLYSAGIRHPKIVEAVKTQLERSPQYSQEMLDPLRAHLAKCLAMLMPGDLQYGFFINSGTEAIEGAMKLAKLHTGKSGFIAFQKGFHGKTLGALSLMGKASFRQPLLPLLEGVRHVPFGDADAVEAVLKAEAMVGNGIAAVIAEPILGEAGAIVPPDDFWPRLRQLCDKYGVLLIADEVQTGLGRTGTIWGVDHWGVTPDIMCLGKALGGGVIPMSGFFSTPKIWKCMEPNPFMHTSTTGGNPVACASALAYLSVMLDEDLPGQAKKKGEYITKHMLALKAKYPRILSEFRGRGLLLGMEFPTDELGYEVAAGCFSKGLLTAGTLINAKTVRIEPALNIPYKLIDEMLHIIAQVFEEVDQKNFGKAGKAKL